MAQNIRTIPADFASKVGTMSQTELAKHYKTSNRKVQKWCDEIGYSRRFGKGRIAWNRRPVPNDFAELAPRLCKTSLAAHYGCSRDVINRWSAEAGVMCHKPYHARCTGSALDRVGQGFRLGVVQTNKTIYDCAADTLRRERFHVHRCNERGGFDLKGQFWRCGYSILTNEELLARAAKYEQRAA